MKSRLLDESHLKKLLRHFPATCLVGPRQCGKTTLAKSMKFQHFFDLENPRDARALAQPQTTLENLKGLIIIDEVQRQPQLFDLLRYLIDQKTQQKYLLLGSASAPLAAKTSESLAGRVAFCSLGGFRLSDVGKDSWQKLWLRGGFPRSFLARSNESSFLWRENYIQTFLERDIPQLGFKISAAKLRRFWILLSHYHGQTLNYAELGRNLGITDGTIRHYLDILKGTFMIHLLQPWHQNTKKRLIKAPKLYLRDSGLFHTLQEIETKRTLLSHPKLGASWEGFALEQALTHLGLDERKAFFWAVHSGAELDLFWRKRGKNYGIEFKFQDAPKRSNSMTTALKELKLSHLWVLYPGKETYPLDKKITVLPLQELDNIK